MTEQEPIEPKIKQILDSNFIGVTKFKNIYFINVGDIKKIPILSDELENEKYQHLKKYLDNILINPLENKTDNQTNNELILEWMETSTKLKDSVREEFKQNMGVIDLSQLVTNACSNLLEELKTTSINFYNTLKNISEKQLDILTQNQLQTPIIAPQT